MNGYFGGLIFRVRVFSEGLIIRGNFGFDLTKNSLRQEGSSRKKLKTAKPNSQRAYNYLGGLIIERFLQMTLGGGGGLFSGGLIYREGGIRILWELSFVGNLWYGIQSNLP